MRSKMGNKNKWPVGVAILSAYAVAIICLTILYTNQFSTTFVMAEEDGGCELYSYVRTVGDSTTDLQTEVVESIIDPINYLIRDEQSSEMAIEASMVVREQNELVKGLKTKYRDALELSKGDMEILYRIVEAESGGEEISGRLLIANVVINRYLSSRFPNTIKGVVFAHSGSTYQFSPIKDGRYHRVKVSSTTKKAVKRAVSGEDNSSGAEYFMARSSSSSRNTRWFDSKLQYLFKHGCHEFFKK